MKVSVFIIFLFCWSHFFGQYSKKPFEQKVFIENKGQFNHELPQKYQDFEYCIDNQTQILIKNNQLVYRFVERHDKEWLEEDENGIKSEEEEEREKEKFKPTYQYVELNWLNSNPNAKIEIEDLSQVKYGYALSWEDAKKGRTLFCKGYKKLIIKNLAKLKLLW